jgi:phospholipase A1/A2
MDVQRLDRALSFAAALVSLAAAIPLASAQVPDQAPPDTTGRADESPEACRAIRTEKERLACYDRLFGSPEGALVEQTPSPPAVPVPELRPASLLEQRWELTEDQKQGTFRVSPYKPVYILAAFLSSGANDTPTSPAEGHSVLESLKLLNTETKFQISLKSKLWQDIFGNNGDLWFGYTQSSRWQLFNAELSRPFRETDYEPELMLNFRTNVNLPWGWDARMTGLSVTHVSNGRDLPLSRSWNRLIGQVGFDRPGWTVVVRPWLRLHEDASSDDNPDIEDYMGRGEMLVTHNFKGHEISALMRHSLRSGERSRGSIELNWAFPIYGELKGYLQYFNGYGESLIDYNHTANYVGLGVSLIEWYSGAAEATSRMRN